MGKIADVQEVTLEKLIPYVNNAKIHGEEQVTKIASSIREFGFLNPVIIDRDYNIIAGHGRVLASKKLGLTEIPCLFVEGLTEAQRKAYILADNRLGELAEWNMDLVTSELESLQDMDFDIDLTGFELTDDELEETYEIEESEIPEKVKSRCKKGDIWKLGDHRLICGDSTSIDDIEKLMGGETVDLLITDPPYNVSYEGKTKEKLTIDNDCMDGSDFYQFLLVAFSTAYAVLKDGAAFYCWYASKEVVNFNNAITDAGFTVKQELIWNKNSLVIGRQDYQWKHEPCLYGWKETGSHNWYGDRKQTTVIDYERPTKSELHPTMKPIGLFAYQIENSSKTGDIVLDLFGGSGTSIMACEQIKRRCYTCELDEHYCDVIIQRWEEFTGKKATKVG